MTRRLTTSLTPWLSHLPGWMFLWAGVTLIAMTLLTQPWLDCRQLHWQLHVMQLQAQRLADQEDAYRQFHEALKSQDPSLIERLACHQLHLKPTGTDAVLTSDRTQTIEQWLHKPLPEVGVDYPPLNPLRTRWVRLATGPARLPLMAVGMLCLTAAVLSATGGHPYPR